MEYISTLSNTNLECVVHGSEFYGFNCVDKLDFDVSDFPKIDSTYRLSNVIVSKESPVVIFRLNSVSQYCIYVEFYIQLSLLSDDIFHCNLIANNKFTGNSDYLGEITVYKNSFYVDNPLTSILECLLKENVFVEDCKDLVRTYVRENVLTNKLCYLIYRNLLSNVRPR